MHFKRREIAPVIAHALVGHEMNDVVAPDQLLGKRLGGKQMPTRSARDKRDRAPWRRIDGDGHDALP